MLKVTIITVVMNLIQNKRMNMFETCVESIRVQDYPEIEHIIIDGASSDGTIELLNKLKLTYYSEPDTGIYNAMNKGIAHATGDIIAFLNSDDYYTDSTVISSVVETFEKTNADMVIGDCTYFFPDKKLISAHSKIENLLYTISVCHQSTFCKLDLMKAVGGFDETYKIAADYHFIHKILLSGYKLVFLNKILSVFREGGISSNRQKVLEEIYDIQYKNFNRFNIKISQKQVRKILHREFLPLNAYIKARKLVCPQLRRRFDARYIKNILKFIRHWLVTVHVRRNRKLIKIFGIVLYTEEKS